jgi:Family of unknown function (DUF6065)
VTVRFIKLYAPAPDVEPASADAKDHAPLRGRKYCAPLNVASAVGWYVFPPLNFHLNWDGRAFYCLLEGFEDWMLIERIVFPNYAEEFQKHAPEYGLKNAPTFLDVFPELGVIQIWTGYIVKTEPGESLWVRGPVNIPGSLQYDVFDGIIETDWWFGALIVNVRFHKTDTPVAFQRYRPLCQVFAVPRAVYDAQRKSEFKLDVGLESLSEADWRAWKKDSDRLNTSTRQGSYIHEAKKYR